jgi:hypothetical protein
MALAAGGVWWARGSANVPTCPPPAAAAPETPGELVLSEQDGLYGSNRQTVQARVGQRLVVRLDAGNFGGWASLRRTETAVDLVSSTGGYVYPCPAAPLVAHLQAQQPGTSTFTSTTDDACFHAQPPCRMPSLTWEVTIQVLPALNGQ